MQMISWYLHSWLLKPTPWQEMELKFHTVTHPIATHLISVFHCQSWLPQW